MIGALVTAFNVVLYIPLFNALVLIYNYFPGHDFGIAIVVLTLIIRLLLFPSSVKAIKTQRALNELQPKIKELQKKYKDDKEKQVKETLELYKQAKVNPFGGLLPTLIQLPLLIALYTVFWKGFNSSELVNLYSFVVNPVNINTMFLGLIDLAKPNIFLAILAGVFQFMQTKTATPQGAKGSDFAATMQKQMIYLFPVLTVFILMGLPSALGLYWATGSLFLVIEQYFVFKKKNK